MGTGYNNPSSNDINYDIIMLTYLRIVYSVFRCFFVVLASIHGASYHFRPQIKSHDHHELVMEAKNDTAQKSNDIMSQFQFVNESHFWDESFQIEHFSVIRFGD